MLIYALIGTPKGIEINQAKQYWQVIGDQDLGMHALSMTSLIV